MVDLESLDPFLLPSLTLSRRRDLPSISCVYFVLSANSVSYIGRSRNLCRRWLDHHQLADLHPESRIAWLEVERNSVLPEMEIALIKRFSPSLNFKSKSVSPESIKAKNDKDPKIKRVMFTPDEEALSIIEGLDDEGKTRSEIVNRAVMVLKVVQGAVSEGGAVYIEKANGDRERIVLVG